MEEQLNNQSIKQKAVSFAGSDYAGAIELLKKCKTRITKLVDENEFKTLVNTITLEAETELIGRLLVAIEEIRKGNISILDD
jgi:hypothetical protein